MDFRLTPEEERFREEVHQFLSEQKVEEVIKGLELANSPEEIGEEARQFINRFSQKGWFSLPWPKEYGGKGGSFLQCFILHDELGYFGLGSTDIALFNMLFSLLILRNGSEELKREFLPRMAKGEIEAVIGWTEPDAGSDLASITTRAEDKGDYYLVNGQKIFTTSGNHATHQYILARTDPNLPKHKGLSVLIIDLKSPGVIVRPVWCMGKEKLAETFFDDVKVPRKYLLGKENDGWRITIEELDLERMKEVGLIRRLLDELVEYVKRTRRDGKLLASDPLVRQALAQLAIEVEVGEFLFLRIAWMLDRGEWTSVEIAMEKAFVCELEQQAANIGMQILGLPGLLEEGSKGAELGGLITKCYLRSVGRTIYMGTSEIQRNIVAIRGLGLPRG